MKEFGRGTQHVAHDCGPNEDPMRWGFRIEVEGKTPESDEDGYTVESWDQFDTQEDAAAAMRSFAKRKSITLRRPRRA